MEVVLAVLWTCGAAAPYRYYEGGWDGEVRV